VPLLLFCNKQDQESAWSPTRINDYFEIGTLTMRLQMNVLGCSVKDQVGIWEGLEWLGKAMDTTTVDRETTAKSTKTHSAANKSSNDRVEVTISAANPKTHPP
jgi:hypothetical protein